MLKSIKTVFNKQSVIQKTLTKITVILFVFMIIFAISTENLFWSNVELKLESQSWIRELSIEQDLNKNANLINKIKSKADESKQEKINEINTILSPLLKSDNKALSGYYDIDFDTSFPLNSTNPASVNEMVLDHHTNTSWGENGEIFNKKPIYINGALTGYVWLYHKDTNVLFEPFQILTLTIIALLLVSILIVNLVRRYFNEIQFYLEEFTKMIIQRHATTTENEDIIQKLPELKPVINELSYYTENLNQMNSELEFERLRIERILEGVTDGFLTFNNNWQCTYINRVAKELFDNVNILGLNLWEACPKIAATKTELKIKQAMIERISLHWEDIGFGHLHQYYEYHAYPYEDGLTVFFQNVTSIKEQQNELNRLQKLNLIGQLAAGIGHEIRNPLTSVRGFLQLLSTKPNFQEHCEVLELMISEIDRANLIITDFLSLAKVNVEHAQYQNINDIVYNLFPLMQADAFNNNKEVRLNLNETDNIMLDTNEIKQLILNIVRNGLEATHTGGGVTISTLQEPAKVVLAIRDDGPGIPSEIQKKVGTPFFTTKDTGTGLGLAISQSIAQRHNALFDFETGKNGTSFFVKFPRQME